MVTPTPLRLVAIEESLQAEDDGAPTHHRAGFGRDRGKPPAGTTGAPTRRDDDRARRDHAKSTRPANVAAREGFPDSPKRFPGGRLCCPSLRSPRARVAIVALATKRGSAPTPHRQRCPYTGSQRRGAVATRPSLAPPAPAAASPAQVRTVHDTIRIEVAAEPRAAS